MEIHESPVADQLWSAARAVLLAFVSYALGREWIADDTSALLLAVIGIAGPMLFSQLKVLKNNKALVELARSVPDDVAVLK